MNIKIKDSFLNLLKRGLWGNKQSSYSNFSLMDEEWFLIYDVAQAQTVEGIIYDGILTLPQKSFPPYDLLMKWTARVDSIERYNKKVRKALAALAQGFYKNDLNFILLKGLGLAENYTKPLLRVSGDIDLYFDDYKKFDDANDLLKSKGYNVSKGDHKSIFYHFNSVEVEHHTRMIDIFNPFCQKYIKELILREKKNIKSITVENQIIHVPSDLLNLVQTNAHILKHYMGFGVGLRQICDVARLYNSLGKDFNGVELEEAYDVLGMRKWMNVIHNLLVDYIGLENSRLPIPITRKVDTESLLLDILQSGNFGFHDVRFKSEGELLSKRYHKRDNVNKRVLPHIKKLLKLAPNEVFWFPVSKLYTKIIRR